MTLLGAEIICYFYFLQLGCVPYFSNRCIDTKGKFLVVLKYST